MMWPQYFIGSLPNCALWNYISQPQGGSKYRYINLMEAGEEETPSFHKPVLWSQRRASTIYQEKHSRYIKKDIQT